MHSKLRCDTQKIIPWSYSDLEKKILFFNSLILSCLFTFVFFLFRLFFLSSSLLILTHKVSSIPSSASPIVSSYSFFLLYSSRLSNLTLLPSFLPLILIFLFPSSLSLPTSYPFLFSFIFFPIFTDI